MRHSGKVAWRALALLERELENEEKAQQSNDRPLIAKSGWNAQTVMFNDMAERIKVDSCQ